jgi:hypothetical protein
MCIFGGVENISGTVGDSLALLTEETGCALVSEVKGKWCCLKRMGSTL